MAFPVLPLADLLPVRVELEASGDASSFVLFPRAFRFVPVDVCVGDVEVETACGWEVEGLPDATIVEFEIGCGYRGRDEIVMRGWGPRWVEPL